MSNDLSRSFKAYDVRGVVPDDINDELAGAVGGAFVDLLHDEGAPIDLVVGYDMRPSSPSLADAFARGASARGADVVVIGLASTDELYCASGLLDRAGAMFTASHNPAKYNGIKLCRPGAAPVGQESGLATIRAAIESGVSAPVPTPGSVTTRDMLGEYVAHLHSLVDLSASRRLTVVVDAGNGMGGHTVGPVFDGLPITLVPMYFELDGSFPNHEANPIDPENLRDLQAKVLETTADIGLAFDGDADRCFVVDERGRVVSPSVLTALIAQRELRRVPGSAVIHNLITSRAVPEVIRENGGTPIRTRVGHSYIKASMAESGAVFGGEHSGHFYFRDFWRADSGMLAAMHMLAALGETDRPCSQLLAPYDRYAASGEINSTVQDQEAVTALVEATYASRDDVTIDHVDGLTVDAADWWFNLRPSNTEPLLRLNVEAVDEPTLRRVRDDVLSLVRTPSARPRDRT